MEIITVSDGPSTHLCVFNSGGWVEPGFPVIFSGFSFTFPVVGDVDGDHQLEIVVGTTAPTGFGLAIYSSTGVQKRIIELEGRVSYGVYIALADMDQDGIPEIIAGDDQLGCCPDNNLYVVKGTGEILPGWPAKIPLHAGIVFSLETPVLVGDVDGDQFPDVVASRGYTYAFDRHGNLISGFPKLGSAMAIADIDNDGRNEIITTGSIPEDNLSPVFPSTINVYDMGGSNHGKIEWGQFGGGPEHRGVYPVPAPPSPHNVSSGQNFIYLPLVSRMPVLHTIKPGVYGHITYQNLPAPNVPVELRYYNGTKWSTIGSASSDSYGDYYFQNTPSLSTGQMYYVRYQNHAPGYLAEYLTRYITNYKYGSELGITDFDLTDISLIQPINGISVSLPYTFTANDRDSLPYDRYSFTLFDPLNGQLYVQTRPYQGAGLILTGLPPGFTTDKPYFWNLWAISPENAIGIPAGSRQVTFINQNPDMNNKIDCGLFFGKLPDLLESEVLRFYRLNIP